MSVLFTIAVFIVVLGVMILVHELGHFIVAKRVGVKVLEFNLGMGPKLFGRQVGETEYMLKALPIGGSVKMLGEEPGETDEEEIDPAEAHRAYFNQAPHKRIAITAAGPILNIVLAVILAPIMFMIGIDEPAYLYDKPVIYTVEKDSPADKAGFKEGDEIVSIDGEKFENYKEMIQYTYLNPGKTSNFEVIRDGEPMEITMTIDRDEKNDVGIAGFDPPATNVVGGFAPNSPAQDAGMALGDRIIRIGDATIESFDDIVKSVRGSYGKELAITVVRDKMPMEFKVTPKFNEQADAYLIGISPKIDLIEVKYPFGQSIKEGMIFLVEQVAIAGIALKKLVTGQLGRKALGGPIEIAYVVGSAARMGFSYLLRITAIICVWLGVINLFPFPALDGGHIIFAIIEIVSRRRLNQKVVDVLNMVGFSLLMALIVFVSIQDVMRHWDGIKDFFLRPWS